MRVSSLLVLVTCATAFAGNLACNKDRATPPPPANPVATQPAITTSPTLGPSTILLPQAQFTWEVDNGGKRIPKPGPAKLLLLTREANAWQESTIEDPDSRVFHKALCMQTAGGTEILTIAGSDAMLKLWRRQGATWSATTLWHPRFGGEWDRLRDVEIGDLDGDGKPEIVIGTHDQGVIAALRHVGDTWQATELYREPATFVHEIELGDLDGDGKLEIYATPSKPNKAAQSQPGRILVLRPQANGRYGAEVVADLKRSHAKEILVTDLNGDGTPELYAAIEAERGLGGTDSAPVEIRRYLPAAKGRWQSTTLASLPGAIQSRVLLAADLTASGHEDLIVTTMKAGVWRLTPMGPPSDALGKQVIDPESTGFEHAAGVADVDGDGKMELYVAADDQDAVRQYAWDGARFVRQTIAALSPSDLTWNIESCTARPLP